MPENTNNTPFNYWKLFLLMVLAVIVGTMIFSFLEGIWSPFESNE